MGLTGSAPAPSFVEAVVGRPAQTPSAGERTRALELLARVIENSSIVPLKLSASLGEQPDFVCSPEVLRFVYALRGDRNFKTGPLTVGNEKVTPLALHCWQAIEQKARSMWLRCSRSWAAILQRLRLRGRCRNSGRRCTFFQFFARLASLLSGN